MPAVLSASSNIVNKVILSTFPFPVTLWLCHILVLSQASNCCCVLGTCLPHSPATRHVNQQKHLLLIMTGDPPIPGNAKTNHGGCFLQQDNFVLPKHKPSTFFYEASRNFKPWMS